MTKVLFCATNNVIEKVKKIQLPLATVAYLKSEDQHGEAINMLLEYIERRTQMHDTS